MGKIIRRFSISNLKANIIYELPFILAISFMLMNYNIIKNIINNEYLAKNHPTLSSILVLGVVAVIFLSIAFSIYANQFVIKKRNKDFSIYGILGLEKKHIISIILFENLIKFIIIFILTNIFSLVFGQLSFLLISKLNYTDSFKNYIYTFSTDAFISTAILTFVIFLILNIYSIFLVRNLSPIELLNRSKSSEKEPKVKYLILILGLIAIFAGYYIALTTKDLIDSISKFMIAVLLVMFATYALFTNFMIFVLKFQKRRKSYYKKPAKFLTVSGLLYRLKSSAAGLASISIFLTGIILTITTTIIIYKNPELVVNLQMPRDFNITLPIYNNEVTVEGKEKLIKNIVKKNLTDGEKVKDDFYYISSQIIANIKDNKLNPYNNLEEKNKHNILLLNLEGYNKEKGLNLELSDSELLVSENAKSIFNDKMIINNKTYKTKYFNDSRLKMLGDNIIIILVPKENNVSEILKSLASVDKQDQVPSRYFVNYYYNLESNNYSKHFEKIMDSLSDENKNLNNSGFAAESKEKLKIVMKEQSASFLFLGIFVSLMLIIGTILITYYKQISEAIEDREKFQAMKKVGLSDDLIKKTSSSQIVIMFFAPLFIAIVHNLIASKIINTLLFIFGFNNYSLYFMYMAIISTLIAIIYFVIYNITSRMYYKIVK